MDRVQAFNGGEGDEKIGWEFHNVTLNRIHGFGFGIAVSGGRDNPHFLNGDPSIAISDVLKAGPAEGKLNVNDRVISANGISLENVDYTTAVQVLRECGSTVNLLIKRRVLLPSSDVLKVTLTKSRKKDDFGIVLGCRIFIKEITNKNVIEKEAGLQKGDAVLKINNTSTENLSLKDAKKLFEASKEKLHLVVKREHSIPSEDAKENALPETNGSMPRASRSNQNLYVQPPTRGDFSRHSQSDEKSNLTKIQHLNGNLPSSAQSTLLNQGYGRNRGPIVDISLSQLDKPATPLLSNTTRNGQEEKDDIPPRPPPPRPHTYGEEDALVRRRHGGPLPDPRLISFQKDGSVGIRLTGGNEVGIFVTAVQPGSPASLQGLQPGDKLLKVNNMEMKGVTREDAVLYLLGVQDQVDLVVQYCKDAYDEIVANQKGDNFYIRTHFTYKTTAKGELDFHYGEVFRVVDTLFSGVVGSWLVYRVGRNGQEIQKGVIPNKSRAEELAAEQSAVEKSKKSDSFTTVTRGNFFKRRSARRSKSLNKDNWDDVVFADGLSKFGAYERVTLRHPGFIRPVVLFGALADVARDKILKDYPDKYASPQLDDNVDDLSKAQKSLGIVRLSAIREIVDKGKHCLLDITPNAVDRLNYAQFYPIVIFLRAENKSVVKELRSRSSSKSSSSSSKKSSRKLFEQSVKMEKLWSHVFTSTLTLTSADMWYKKLRETIERQQQSNIWMGEAKPEGIISDDFLFPMTSRLSYASSPESDLDLVHDPKGRDEGHSPRLVKASSDPSIATVEEVSCNSFGNLPPYTRSKQELTKTLTKTNGFPGKSDDLDREDHFGTSKDNYNSLYSVERYTGENDANKDSNLYESHTTAPKETGPEPPPRVDRHMKPNRFRTAHERLFGKSERRDVNSAPDYINTTLASTRTPNSSASKLPGVDHVRQGSRGSVLENGSYSGDSYKYISPSGTLDDRKYGSLTSANSNSTMRLPHDPYRYTRSTAQPLGMPGSKPADRNSKAFPTVPGQPPPFPMENGMRPAPPSPPPKPCNYPSMRLSDGRPVPPPKPFTYQTGRQPWRPDCDAETEVAFNGSQAPMINGTSNGGPYMPNNWNNVPNVDMSGGPPAYFPPTKDQLNGSSVMQSNGDMQPSYANHQAVSSPNRRMLYSDTDSSSGYMTGKSSYDMRSQYSSKTSSSRSSSMMNGNGPYLNVPYPPRHREASNGVPTFTSSPSNGLQPPMNLIDLSNRENRGSAFELYRKPGDSIPRTGYHYHSLAAPPPPPPAPMIPIHDSK